MSGHDAANCARKKHFPWHHKAEARLAARRLHRDDPDRGFTVIPCRGCRQGWVVASVDPLAKPLRRRPRAEEGWEAWAWA